MNDKQQGLKTKKVYSLKQFIQSTWWRVLFGWCLRLYSRRKRSLELRASAYLLHIAKVGFGDIVIVGLMNVLFVRMSGVNGHSLLKLLAGIAIMKHRILPCMSFLYCMLHRKNILSKSSK